MGRFKILLAASAALFGFLPAAVAVSPSELLRRGDYEDAVEGFQKELQEDSKRVAAVRGWAEALSATGKYSEALAVLEESELYHSSPDLLCAGGRILLRSGKLEEAESSFRAALKKDPDDVEGLTRLGDLLSHTGRREEAEKLWGTVIDIYQAYSNNEAEELPAEDFVEMGRALVGLNRFKDANRVMFSQAEEKDPKCPQLLLEWGKIFMEKYNFPDSRDALREAIDQNPRFADARVLMAENYLLDFQVGTQRYELAEKQIEKALEVNPNHAGAYAARGSLWLSDGNLPRAEKDFRKALEVDPASLCARGLLAACHHLSSREQLFAAEEKKAREVNSKPAEFYLTIARAIERRFRYQDAVQMSDRALELVPDYWPAYHTLAINCLRTGDEERAREFLDKSFEKDPFNVWVFNSRKLLRYMDKNHKLLETPHFLFKFPTADYDVLSSFLAPLLEKAYERLAKYYRVELEPPIRIEVFSEHQWFSARIAGLPGYPASGACFGNVVALTTPKALPQNWGAVAWHEFAHVVTLHATKNRVPRWLTEGLSVYEEGRDFSHWARNFERQIADHYASDRLLPIGELDWGFSKPRYPGQVLISYFQGCLVVRYIEKRWSFDKVLDILAGYAANKSTAEIFKETLDVSLEEFDRGFFAFVADWVKKNGYEPRIYSEVITGKLEPELVERPNDVDLLRDLAWAYFCDGNDIDAPLTANKGLKLAPENGDFLAILGFCDLDDKKTKSAKEYLEKALEKSTHFRYRVHAALGEIARRAGETDEAIRHFEQAKTISPRAGAAVGRGRSPNLYYKLASLYSKTGEEEKAMGRLEELRALAGEDARCRDQLVKYYLRKDDDDAAARALQILDEMVYINPFDRKLHERLAQVAARLGCREIAIREYTYLLKFPDTNPRVAYLELAKAYLGLGKREEARKYASKVLSLDEENEEAKEILESLE